MTTKMRDDIIVSENKTKPSATDQFRKLLKKLSLLEKEAQVQREQLEKLLNAFLQDVKPTMNKRMQLVDEWIQQLMRFYGSIQLKKHDKPILTEIISSQLKEYTHLSEGQLPEHLSAIFETIEGMTFEEAKESDFDEKLQAISDKFAEAGFDFDLSELNQNSSEEDVRKFFAEKIEKEFQNKEESNSGQKKKTKRQEAEERKEKLAEELKNKSINSVYRELAKAIHPDLEQDPEMRKIKEEVMKELTSAYEKQDLRTLFRLEMEWLQKEESDLDTKPDELLKIYKTMLKDQIDDLKLEIELEETNPRFAMLRLHIPLFIQLRDVNISEFIQLEEDFLKDYEFNVTDIKKYHPPVLPKNLRELISRFRRENNNSFNWDI